MRRDRGPRRSMRLLGDREQTSEQEGVWENSENSEMHYEAELANLENGWRENVGREGYVRT